MRFAKRLFNSLCVICLAITIAACETAPTKKGQSKAGGKQLEQNNREQYTASEFEKVQDYRSQIYTWDLTGSFSYVDPDESAAGRIKWNFSGDLLDKVRLNDVIKKENVTLVGPLGTGSVELISTVNEARLISGRQQYDGLNVETLLMNVIGWRLPIDDIRFWLFGLPSPNNPGKYWLNDQGMMQTLHQSDWEIEFEQYERHDSENNDTNTESSQQPVVMLPKKITAVHRDNQAKVKLVIKNFISQQSQ